MQWWYLPSALLGSQQQKLSDRVHRAGDQFARNQGWSIACSTGQLGFGAREYRDARFDRRQTPVEASDLAMGPRRLTWTP